VLVRVDEVGTLSSGSPEPLAARFRVFSFRTGGFLAGYDATDSFPTNCARWADETPDGKLLAEEWVDLDNPSTSVVLRLYDWRTGRRINQLRLPSFGPVRLSQDGKYLAWLTPAGGAIFSVPALDSVGKFKDDFQEDAVFAGTRVALPLWQQSRIRLWDLVLKEDVALLEEPAVAAPAAFSEDGGALLTAGRHHARLYRLRTPEKLELPPHAGTVASVAFSPDGARLASIGKDRVVRVCDARTGRIAWQVSGLPRPGQCVCYSPDGKCLATGDYGSDSIRVWDAQTGTNWLELGTNSFGLTFSVEFSHDGRWLAAAGQNGVRLWALQRDEPTNAAWGLSARLVRSFAEDSMSLVIAPDSQSLAFFSPSNLYVWHLDDRAEPHRVALGPAEGLQAETATYLWHFDWSGEIHRVASGVAGSAQSLAFSPNDYELLAADGSGAIVILDTRTGKPIRSFGLGQQARGRGLALSLSLDGSKLALSSMSETAVSICDPNTGELLYTLPQQPGSVDWLAWGPDSRRMAIAHGNGRIEIWDLEAVSQILAQLGLSPMK